MITSPQSTSLIVSFRQLDVSVSIRSWAYLSNAGSSSEGMSLQARRELRALLPHSKGLRARAERKVGLGVEGLGFYKGLGMRVWG